MKRFALFVTLAGAVLFTSPAMASATVMPYTMEAGKQLMVSEQPIALHFHAAWCSICRKQDKIIQGLLADPKLGNVTVYRVDFDKEKDLRKKFNITSQSTVIVLKGQKEVSRTVGVTDGEDLRAQLMAAAM